MAKDVGLRLGTQTNEGCKGGGWLKRMKTLLFSDTPLLPAPAIPVFRASNRRRKEEKAESEPVVESVSEIHVFACEWTSVQHESDFRNGIHVSARERTTVRQELIPAPLRDARRQRFQRKRSSGETELVSSFSLSVVRLTVWLTSVYERGKGKRSGEECGASMDVRSFPALGFTLSVRPTGARFRTERSSFSVLGFMLSARSNLVFGLIPNVRSKLVFGLIPNVRSKQGLRLRLSARSKWCSVLY
ncbi:hypothetical protein LR48_Vigan05g074500 [Vigna angularis]|uniref:Uncharacterized protein n=1 Tax=Phaseolus angularis TaxID=3914 RepID=A0A0L9UKC4_PHAAN|nr:hypothetical protein LR48_Vigan05g074500 [Vigna angularis]